MPVTLKKNLFKVRDNPSSNYTTVDVISDGTTDERVNAIITASSNAQQDIVNKKNDVIGAISTVSELQNMISNVFDPEENYSSGDYVIHSTNSVNKLYRFTANHPAGDWTGTDVVEVMIGNDIIAEAAARQADVNDLKSAMSALGISTLTQYPFVQQGYITTDTYKWNHRTSGSNRCAIIPVNGGETVYIKASENYTLIAALKTFANPATGDTPDYSTGIGWTAPIRVNANAEYIGMLSDDAKYLYVWLGSVDYNFSRAPLHAVVNSYDYAVSAAENINGKAPIDSPAFTGNPTAPTQEESDNSTKIATTAYADRSARNHAAGIVTELGAFRVTDDEFLHQGYIDSSAGWVSSSQYCSVIPVTPGVSFYMKAGAKANIAFLSSYSVPAPPENPSYAQGTGLIVVDANQEYRETAIPNDAHYLYVYLRNRVGDSYERTPQILLIGGYDYTKPFVANLDQKASLASPAFTGSPTAPTQNPGDNSTKLATTAYVDRAAPLRLRVMQYNLGHFNMGQSVGDGRTTYYLTSANYATVLASYKAMFEQYAPDIAGFEEFESSVMVQGINGASDTTHDMDAELFDLYFPYSDESSTSMSSRRATKSKYAFTDTKRQQVAASYTYNGQEITYTFIVVYSHFNIRGKTIAVVTTPYSATNNTYTEEQNDAMKKAAFSAVANLCANDENVILISDTNASPTLQESIMNEILGPAGYNAVIGGYLRFVRWPVTWKSYTNNTELSIDNIFVKGDLIPVNYNVLWGLRDDLASDHAAIYADFLLF